MRTKWVELKSNASGIILILNQTLECEMAAPYPPTPATATPSTRAELHISCDNLRDADLFSKSDPVVVVYTQTRSKQWVEVSGHP